MPLDLENIKAEIVKNEDKIKALEKKDFNFKSEVSLRSQVVNNYIKLFNLIKNSDSELEECGNKLIGQCNVLYGIYRAYSQVDKVKKVEEQILTTQERLNKSRIKNANTRTSNVNTTLSTRVAYDSFGTPVKTPREALATKDLSVIDVFADDLSASPNTRMGMMEFATSLTNKEIVEKILSYDIRSKDDFGYGMIHYAAMGGYLDVVKAIIQKDPNLIKDLTRNGSLPIHLAAKGDNKDLVELLIDQDVGSIEVPDGRGYLPIHLAVSSCERDLVALFIERNADINVLSRSKKSPLELAIINGQTDIVKLLIDKNVDTNIEMSDGSTPAELAERKRNVDILNLLSPNSSECVTDNLNRSVRSDWEKKVVSDIQFNREESFKELLCGKNSTFILSSRYCTIVHLAASYAKENIFNLIVAEVELKEAEDYFSYLVRKQNRNGNTALHLASTRGKESIMNLLIENITDDTIFNIKNNDGMTALHCAVKDGREGAVKILLGKSSVDVNATDKDEDSPLHLAISLGQTSIAKLLIEKESVDIDAQNECQITPLHLAIRNSNCYIAQLLIKRGANVRALDNKRNSVLHFAANSNSSPIVEDLLKLGAGSYLNICNNNRRTPMELAKDSYYGEEVLDLFNLFENKELPFQQKRQGLEKCFQTSIREDDLGVTPLSSVESPSSERHNNSSRGREGGL